MFASIVKESLKYQRGLAGPSTFSREKWRIPDVQSSERPEVNLVKHAHTLPKEVHTKLILKDPFKQLHTNVSQELSARAL